ncbi:MAG: hypothetical protein Q8P18_20450 [Pseudomonadota bacterium]|nr:hypothetical protein [Pseudomonadota bacterium]
MRLPALGALWVVYASSACTRPEPTPVGCPSFADTIVTNPDGVATDEDIAEAEAALADFAAWTAADGVCVGEVRIVADADPELERITGSFSASERLVLVEPGGELGIARTVVHELCHAWDTREGFSDAHAELVPTNRSSEPDLYDLYDVPVSEYFAFACERGPLARALAEAAVAACGPEDPWHEILREEVFPGYEESIPVGVGVEFSARELALLDFPDDRAAYHVQSFGDQLVMQLDGGAVTLVLVDLATLSWREVEVPSADGKRSWLVTTLPDAPPVMAVQEESGAITFLQLDGDQLVPHPVDWLAPILEWEGGTTMSIGTSGATWQLWGDGLPMQARAFHGGEAYEVPGPAALLPTGMALPEGELAWERGPFFNAPWSVAPESVAPAWVPVGVTPRATLPDGRVVATANWYSPDGEQNALLLRDTDDSWWFSPSSCTTGAYAVGIFAGGGRIVRVAGTAPLRLEELVVEAGAPI